MHFLLFENLVKFLWCLWSLDDYLSCPETQQITASLWISLAVEHNTPFGLGSS